MSKDPAILFYYKDFDSDTADWEADAVGWYMRLLIFQSGNGYVPSGIEDLAQVARVRFSDYQTFCERWTKRLACKFETLSEGKLYNKFLSKVQSKRKSGAIKKSVLAVFGNYIKSEDLSLEEEKELKILFHKDTSFYDILDSEKRKEDIILFLYDSLIKIKQRIAKRSQQGNETGNVNEDIIKDEKEERGAGDEKPEKVFTEKDFPKILIDLGADKIHVKDWMKVRKNKKSTNSETALKKFVNECANHKYPVAKAVEKCAENSWAGFKHEWVLNLNEKNGNRNNGKNGTTTTDFGKVLSGIDALYGD